MKQNKSPFKWRHFEPTIILLCVRWYCRYSLSYRDIEEMMRERGLSVDHVTVFRWVQRYAPEINRRMRPHLKLSGTSYRIDETYVKVGSRWKYLYRAVDSSGDTIEFMLSAKRSLSGETDDVVVTSDEFGKKKGLVVVDYFIANTRLKELIEFYKSSYLPFLKANGTPEATAWVSELAENDFPALPAFQDKNLLVTITPYKDEAEYQRNLRQINADRNRKILTGLREIVTTRTTLVLYPTKNSFAN
jgi:transposase-like protein